jgi:predicted nucleotidyltransferase component of viral defense system
MIPEIYVEQWRSNAPWQTLAMIEQDLIIGRALVEMFNSEIVKTSLAFRGGTALNKLYVPSPVRYSEDVDLVQIEAEPIGETLDAIRAVIDPWLGEPKRKFTERSAKLIYRYMSVDNVPAKLKIEINTTEHCYLWPLEKMSVGVNSEWYSGSTFVTTYQLNELMGTKLKALYQRRKGRDLFDLWYCLEKKLIDVDKTLFAFSHYCQNSEDIITRAMFEQNLFLKKKHRDFQLDILPLLAPSIVWDFDKAMQLVEENFILKLEGEAWQGK